MGLAMIHKEYYKTKYGYMYLGKCENILQDYLNQKEFIPVNLLFTSPPFPLNRAKKYGNLNGKEYLDWFSSLAPMFSKLLAQDGSIVVEIGNAWETGLPIHSTLPIETLIAFKKEGDFNLCQEFMYYNPAKLPSPVEWVNKRRIRVKDSFTRIWWFAKNPYPKADNNKVKEEYSKQMLKLLKSGKYNSGKRPSEYHIGQSSFLKNNNGAIPSNVLIAANTCSKSHYFSFCRDNNLPIHPSRMPESVPTFFVKFLTDEEDLVLDPFSGSNTTGSVCEKLHRRWLSIEVNEEYVKGSLCRFQNTTVAYKKE